MFFQYSYYNRFDKIRSRRRRDTSNRFLDLCFVVMIVENPLSTVIIMTVITRNSRKLLHVIGDPKTFVGRDPRRVRVAPVENRSRTFYTRHTYVKGRPRIIGSLYSGKRQRLQFSPSRIRTFVRLRRRRRTNAPANTSQRNIIIVRVMFSSAVIIQHVHV